MTDFQTVRGFEDVWRPPVRLRRRSSEAVLSSFPTNSGMDVRARLTRLANRAPEVMVKLTGRTRDQGGLRAHLDYISRNGQLELEDRDGAILAGRAEVKELAEDWSAIAMVRIGAGGPTRRSPFRSCCPCRPAQTRPRCATQPGPLR